MIEKVLHNGGEEDNLLVNQLRDIILKNDRSTIQRIASMLDDEDQLSELVAPVVDRKITQLKQKFPREFQLAVNQIVEKKMQESQEELLDLIYPVLGKMIKKYIVHQFEELKENIDRQINSIFTIKGLRIKLKSIFYGIDDSALLLSKLDKPEIEEIHIIERDSGILYGSVTLRPTIDRDVVAGMLTAIKSFVEDAFQRDKEDLEMIEYGTYKIFIQNFRSYYFCVAMSGSLSATQKEKLSTAILDFAEKEIAHLLSQDESNRFEVISEKLRSQFYSDENILFE